MLTFDFSDIFKNKRQGHNRLCLFYITTSNLNKTQSQHYVPYSWIWQKFMLLLVMLNFSPYWPLKNIHYGPVFELKTPYRALFRCYLYLPLPSLFWRLLKRKIGFYTPISYSYIFVLIFQKSKRGKTLYYNQHTHPLPNIPPDVFFNFKWV